MAELSEKICKCLCEILDEFENNHEKMTIHEVGEVADIIKDLAEAKESIVKAEYYSHLTVTSTATK